MRQAWIVTVLISAVAGLLAGCATTPNHPAALQTAEKSAWSLSGTDRDLVISVSPAGRTLRIAGSAGTLVGASVDAVVNDKYRQALAEALGDYAPGNVLEEALATRLQSAVPNGLDKVAPLGSTAGYASVRQAEDERFAALGKRGFDTVLDLDAMYGLYGPEAELVITLNGVLRKLPQGSAVWRDELLVSVEPILMGQKLGDPTERLKPNLTSPRLSVDEQGVMRWTAKDGTVFKDAFLKTADQAAAALVSALGLQQDAVGEYQLGRMALLDKQFDAARSRFEKSLAITPGAPEVVNALAVATAYKGDTDAAIDLAKQILATSPDYAPANYNLAWWLAIDKKDSGQAHSYYDHAVSAGITPAKKLEEAMEK